MFDIKFIFYFFIFFIFFNLFNTINDKLKVYKKKFNEINIIPKNPQFQIKNFSTNLLLWKFEHQLK
jgi:hypothetical protein